jgi:hypothetical protein
MKGLSHLGIALGITLVGLLAFTRYEDRLGPRGRSDGIQSVTRVAGYPVVSMAQGNAKGLIAIGQYNAWGILVLGQNGYGVVAVVQGGVGLIFGLGQAVAGLLIIAQVGIGLFFFLGQMGGGAQAAGQGVWRKPSKGHFKAMGDELTEVLRFPRLGA